MRVSGIALKQRETEIKALRLFVASSLVGSLVVHLGLLASGILNINVQVPKPENEPIELTFIDPPIPEETKEPPKPEPPEPEPPKPEPQQLEKIEPLLPEPETITNSFSNPGGSSASSTVPEISEFKPQAPPKPLVPQTPRPKVEQIEPPKPIQPPPQIAPKPVPQPQPTQEANENLRRLLTQEKDSRTKPELSIPQTPIQEPQPTQKTNEDLRRLLAKQERNSRTPREFSPDPTPTQSPKATQADSKKLRRILTENPPSSPSDTFNSSPKIAANKDTSSRRRRRDFAGNNEVATAPTTPNPGTGSGIGNLTGDGDGRAACRRCRTSYPSWAKRKGVEGRITVALDTDSQGNVTNVRLISSSGNNRLDQEHLKLARKWKLKSSSNGRKGVRIVTNYVLE
ncbi:energy transducer TonB [Mastigocoleus testarum]|uniref:TonB C-terminal domain-containing protein n=1 Tax=Mastigocoleus testarum BC008 TaxID=371196 RepID=A0A0V7ZN55_9CYAN|nr:energy transducer TonB [Mastigocoleus testarum]KST65981.1 hypothetical protein BC008_23690 [Mastigocoleus testarum BC008]